MTQRELVSAAFMATQAGVAQTVGRNRRGILEESEYDAVIVYDGAEEIDYRETGYATVTAEFEVEGHVQADDDASLGAAMNTLYAAVVKRAMAEPPLGGLATDVKVVRYEPDIDLHAKKPTGAFVATFEVEYQTAAGDPFAT